MTSCLASTFLVSTLFLTPQYACDFWYSSSAVRFCSLALFLFIDPLFQLWTPGCGGALMHDHLPALIGGLVRARRRPTSLLAKLGDRRLYFVHSYRATPRPQNEAWVAATTAYGGPFVSAVQRGHVAATQFHPEKSGVAGLDVLSSFLRGGQDPDFQAAAASPPAHQGVPRFSSRPEGRGLAMLLHDVGHLLQPENAQGKRQYVEGKIMQTGRISGLRRTSKPVGETYGARWSIDCADEPNALPIPNTKQHEWRGAQRLHKHQRQRSQHVRA